ncbi:hypothetical protein A1Q1_06785 [Trichosporon asahii var. asahii CBS 2479]|uniref:Nuclease I n=1 Tax=Trichosporon asahii var. asahii (strain ATCC 90039 / CBS 2479 / JCM 2466 / KCTC 7840 / NBRC 103889/ NCYC 2677 / UAMH 7654) TaxID=1186058 RepID=J6F4Q7_TRIAS|nr:hypothetical protein A1Q1_06785 [Trichosporon asahii var. asahii CBS 2479]EJT51979.1 hypothetical protein A1Q1_06785 [Trichosporon asahii var. asahii CBS 2479]
MKTTALALAAAAFAPNVLAWGAAGHEIVATIAEIHLYPEVKEKLCHILPPEAECHLAPVAAWADTVRGRYPGTGPMHYVNPKEDNPGTHCTFGEHGWINEDVNVLTAIVNKTEALRGGGGGDINLRFLIHLMGDLHQPLHLTGRDRGGNNARFKFEGRVRSLHSVWDSGILLKNIREFSNYTAPLPSKHIEEALPGAIFDSYVRWIVWEGIRQWWPNVQEEWLACPADGDPYPHSLLEDIPRNEVDHGEWYRSAVDYAHGAVGYLPNALGDVIRLSIPAPVEVGEGMRDALLELHPKNEPKHIGPACPYTWAREIHGTNCAHAWPLEYDPHGPLIELDTDEYLGKIGRAKVLERLFAMGGLRLAKVLNEAVSDGKLKGVYVNYPKYEAENETAEARPSAETRRTAEL